MPNQQLADKTIYSHGEWKEIVDAFKVMAAEASRKERRKVTVAEMMRRVNLAAASDTLRAKGIDPEDFNPSSEAWRDNRGRRKHPQDTKTSDGAQSIEETVNRVVQQLVKDGWSPPARKTA